MINPCRICAKPGPEDARKKTCDECVKRLAEAGKAFCAKCRKEKSIRDEFPRTKPLSYCSMCMAASTMRSQHKRMERLKAAEKSAAGPPKPKEIMIPTSKPTV